MSSDGLPERPDMSSNRWPKVMGFTLVRPIGTGGFSTVYMATHFEERRSAAVKVVFITAKTTEAERKALDREMRIHGALNDDNILQFMDAVVVEKATKYVPAVYMLLEMAAGGDLFDKIVPDVGIDSDIAQHYFTQLASGVRHIHAQGVVHRDLKPENLLLDGAGTLKISDFGLAAVWHIKESGRTRQLTDVCGSLPYIAPELALGKPYSAPPIDVWGLGVILFTLLVGNTPWDEPTARSPEFTSYFNNQFHHEEPWRRIPGPELSLIMGLLEVEPAKRMTIPQIFGHAWMMSPSQLVHSGSIALAERLTKNLRESGALDIAAPPQMNPGADLDGDIHMMTAPGQSQFSQALMLFSQTQKGTQHNPHLTRFYADASPVDILSACQQACTALGVKTRVATGEDGQLLIRDGGVQMRVGGLDQRKEQFKGTFAVDEVDYNGRTISIVNMRRESGSALSWRKLWKDIVVHELVAPCVLRRQR